MNEPHSTVGQPDALTRAPDRALPDLVTHGLLCCQHLHLVGATEATLDHDEAFVVLSMLDVLVGRILSDSPVDATHTQRLRDARKLVHEVTIGVEESHGPFADP